MAEALFENFLTCPICLEPLKEPVSLSCHHSFCQTCLNKTWNTRPNKTCPMCRRRSSQETVEVKEEKVKEPKVKQAQVCSSHPGVPPLFCLVEARAFCPVCEFFLHSQHMVVSEDEAKKRLKEQVQTQIQALKYQKQSYEELEKTYEQVERHHEEQTVECMSLGLELQKVRKEITTLTNNIQDLQNSIVTQSLLSAPTQTLQSIYLVICITKSKSVTKHLNSTHNHISNRAAKLVIGLTGIYTSNSAPSARCS
uniref:RING-type domain-containing protein n=1 Tax=Periophthalmus magnuspinnatus TaxID=409849 RepID=A0A3B3Z726_9GOBI